VQGHGHGAGKDHSIALDKAPLLPGQTATFAGYSVYRRGINGLQVAIGGTLGPFSRQR
jgi:hypothetical protein